MRMEIMRRAISSSVPRPNRRFESTTNRRRNQTRLERLLPRTRLSRSAQEHSDEAFDGFHAAFFWWKTMGFGRKRHEFFGASKK